MTVKLKHQCLLAPVLLMAIMSFSSLDFFMVYMSQHLQSISDEVDAAVQAENQLNRTVITWKDVDGTKNAMMRFWKGNLFCEINKIRSEESDWQHPITLHVSFGCNDLFENSGLGTGNYIQLFYGIRLAAHVYGNVDVNFTCYDAKETKNALILPWLMGWFPPRPMSQNSSIHVSTRKLCNNYSSGILAHMHKEIQYDFRKMAIGLMGIPHPDHPSARYADRYLWSPDRSDQPGLSANSIPQLPLPQRKPTPPYPASKHDLDDAVLHFRCGDLMDSTSPYYAFIKFSGYTRHISSAATSIGILTQPFDSTTQGRKADAEPHKRDRCRIVVYSLFEYIQQRYPLAKVRIHNGVGETIALTYARMIMANQTIAGISTFGVIPAISTFGTGYIRTPDYPSAPNKWLLSPRIDDITENVVLFKEPHYIMVEAMKDLWETQGEKGVLKWFWNDSFVYRYDPSARTKA